MAKFRLDNKTAVITGGASGIGRSIAETFAQQGAHVFILDINQEAAKDLAKALQLKGWLAKSYKADLTKQKTVQRLIEKIHAQHPIDILVNNAGVGFVGNLEQTPALFTKIS
ncbi:MAG: SDR family NAD(P)-dependent oxidoreductase, partial [Bacteroidota bacterium]